MSELSASIVCELTVEDGYELGKPKPITVTLRNASPSAIWVLVDTSSLCPNGRYASTVMRQGRPAALKSSPEMQGATVRKPIRIAAGMGLLTRMNIAGTHAITYPESYTVRVSATVGIALETTPNVPPALMAYEPSLVASDLLRFEVRFPAEPLDPVFEGLNASEREVVQRGHRAAYRSILAASRATKGGQEYLGWMENTITSTGTRKVTNAFVAMATWMSVGRVIYSKVDTITLSIGSGNAVAGVRVGERRVLLTDRAFRVDETMEFIVIHEVSHAAVATKDVRFDAADTANTRCYARSDCRAFAAENPSRALVNAQNYAFYATALSQGAPAVSEAYQPDDGMWHRETVPSMFSNAGGVGAAGIEEIGVGMIACQTVLEADGIGFALFGAPDDAHLSGWWDANLMRLRHNDQVCSSIAAEHHLHANRRLMAPALLGVKEEGSYFFYAVYVDPHHALVMVKSSPIELALAARSGRSIRWTAVSNLSTLASSSDEFGPALAIVGSKIYCAYITADKKLKCLVRGDDGNFVEIDTRIAQKFDSISIAASSPSLAGFGGELFCAAGDGLGGKIKQMLFRYAGGAWVPCPALGHRLDIDQVALVACKTSVGDRLLAVGTTRTPGGLSYCFSTGSPFTLDESWGYKQRMSVIGRAVVGLTSMGPTAHAFYQHEDGGMGRLVAQNMWPETSFESLPVAPAPVSLPVRRLTAG